MKRLLRLKKTFPALLAILGMFFLVPGYAQGVGFLDIITTPSSFVLSLATTAIEIVILPVASGLMYLAGVIMDNAIKFSLNTAYIFGLSPAINMGWVIVRDIMNIFFIFILIFISLGTIVNGLGFGTKKMLIQVVIAAVLINFSLFITKAVIDVSNVFGNWLYGGIIKTLVVNTDDCIGDDCKNHVSLSGLIATRLNIISLWGDDATPNAQDTNNVDPTDSSNSMIGRFLRLAVVLIAAYVFLYAAVIFISRAITLLFLLVFSPIGFMGEVLPQIKDYSTEWRKELTNAAMFPIVFLLMLYISLQFINGLDVALADKIKGEKIISDIKIFGGSFDVLFYFKYFLIIFLLQATLKVAKKYSGEMGAKLGGMAEGLGKMAIGAVSTYATGGATMYMRAAGRSLGAGLATIGTKDSARSKMSSTFNDNIAPSKLLKGYNYLKNKNLGTKEGWKSVAGDARDATANKMKAGTWDVRNIGTKETSVGSLLTSVVSSATGLTLDLKGKNAEVIKTEKAGWAEEIKIDKAEIKIDKASQAILVDIDGVLKNKSQPVKATKEEADRLKIELDKDPTNPTKQTSYATAQTNYASALTTFNNDPDVQKAKGSVSDQVQKLGNKQLESLSKKILGDEVFVQTISQSQAEHLAEKAETDEDKAKIWSARLSDVTSAINSNAPFKEIRSAIKNHSDEELGNLPPDILRNPLFVNPEAMDYDKFDKIIKSKKLTNSAKNEMRNARYDDVFKKADTGSSADIETAISKMQANEISKLGDKFFRKDIGTVAGLNVDALNAVASRGNTEILDKMVQNDTDDTTRGLIKNHILAHGNKPPYKKLHSWLTAKNGRGLLF